MAKKFLTDIDIAGGIYDSSGDIGNSGQVLSSTGSGLNWIDSAANSSVIYQDAFSGNGSTVAFTLANSIDNENKTQVYIDGVYQFKNTYSISGTTLTFSTAPPNNTNIEVISFNSITVDGDILTNSEFGSAGLMTTNGSGVYSITTNNSSNWNTAYTYSQVGHLPLAGGAITGAITTNSTFDGRNVSVDGTKLDGIEASATADQTNAEIKAAVEAAADSNTFTDADHTKLNAIEASADVTDTANVTSAGALMDSELVNLAAVKAINQELTTSSNVAFGNITTTGYLRGPASFTIDPATHGDDTGTLIIAGNLQVDGTTTTINSTTVAIDDLNFSIANDAADSAAANGAGITIGGASATLLYTHATTSWDMNKPLNITTGGLSIAGDAIFGGTVIEDNNSLSRKIEIAAASPVGLILNDTRDTHPMAITNDGAVMNFRYNTTSMLSIDGASNTATFAGIVGVKNTNPGAFNSLGSTAQIVIGNADAVSNLTMYSATSGYGSLAFGDSNSSSSSAQYSGLIQYYHADNSMKFYTSSAPRVTILGNGNVGVGSTNPSSKFQVEGAPANGVYLSYLYNSATHNSAHGLNVQTTTNNILTYGLRVNTGGDSNALAVMGNGTVGIGTGSPSSKLHIASSAASNLILKLEQDNASYESWFEANSQDGGFFRAGISHDANNFAFFNTDQASYRWYGAGGGSPGMILTNGLLGIGTSSPTSPASVGTFFEIRGRNGVGAGTAGLVLKDYDNDAWDIWNSGGQLNFRYNNNQNIGFNINSSGAAAFAGNVTLGSSSKASDEWMYIDSDGSSSAGIQLLRAGAAKWFIYNPSGTNNFKIYDNSGGGYMEMAVGGNTTFTGQVTATGRLTVNTGGGIAAYFNGNGSNYTQGAITLQSSNESTPEARGQGVFMYNQGTDTTWYTGTTYSNADRFIIGRATNASLNTEAARIGNAFVTVLNNGNVGIGTNTPGNLLDVAGDTDISGQLFVQHSGSYTAKLKQLATSMSNATYTFEIDSTAHTSNLSSAGAMSVDVDSGRAFTINGLGNVGIGTNSPSARLDVSQASGSTLIRLSNSDATLVDAGDIQARLLFAGRYYSGSGTQNVTSEIRQIKNNGDGYGGGAEMAFLTNDTEKMRIKANGNVGIGTATPGDFDGESRNLVIRGGVNGSTPTIGMTISTAGNQASTGRCAIRFADGISGNERYRGAIEYNHNGDDMSFRTAGTVKMVIDNLGQVGIGAPALPTDVYTASGGGYAILGMGQSSFLAAYKADDSIELCQNTYVNTSGANNAVIPSIAAARLTLVDGQFVFQTLQTASNYSQTAVNAMKITPGAELFVGDTGTNYGYSAHHIAKDSSQGYALIVRNSNTTTTNNSVIQLNQATTGTNGYFMICRQGDPNSGTNRLFIFSNGNIQNVNNSYGAISDGRLKENIVDATPKLDDLMKVKVRNFNLKGEETKQIGVVAQELEEVFPGMIDESKDPDSEDETLYKSVKYSVFVPMLIKAIQELKSDNDSLKARIETLENN